MGKYNREQYNTLKKEKKKIKSKFVTSFKRLDDIQIPDEDLWFEKIRDKIEKHIASVMHTIIEETEWGGTYKRKLDASNYADVMDDIRQKIKNFDYIESIDSKIIPQLCRSVYNSNEELKEIIGDDFELLYSKMCSQIKTTASMKALAKKLDKYFSETKILCLLSKNPHHVSEIKKIIIKEDERRKEKKLIEDNLPKNYIDIFPKARQLKRHFVIHSGPTNSGKTYDSIQTFLKSKTGIYLAPLRLLALETYETANKSGVSCSMITGEEVIEVPFSNHVSSTIEMLDIDQPYDVAVIDEAQMLADVQRGGAWTTAILGVCAKEVHICTASHAVNLIIKMIESCGDTYELHKHERMTPLIADSEKFSFPRSVKSRDALILFSKKSLLACAATLQQYGLKTSIIYGALPYDVRKNEVDKFTRGETDVVVATDAIGMGVNLPIQRIVFLENFKYDGSNIREIKPAEVAQIAGRAGRKGIFDIGYYNALKNKGLITDKLKETIPDLEYAHIDCPRYLIHIDLPLSTIFKRWSELSQDSFYSNTNIENEIRLCKMLEQRSDDKDLIFDFVNIPFNDQDDRLLQLWLDFFLIENQNPKAKSLDSILSKYNIKLFDSGNALEQLEYEFQVCDLICFYLNKFNHKEYLDIILRTKKEISVAIIEILSKQHLKGKKCRICGQAMAWDAKYNICDPCYFNNIFYDC